MQYFFLLIFSLGIILTTNSCYKSLKTVEPKLEEEVMVKLLADIHLAEARLSDYNSMPAQKRDSFAVAYYSTIFEIHNVDTADFQQSMQAYMGNPKAVNTLYEKVLTRLQQNETKYVKGSKEVKDRTEEPKKSKLPKSTTLMQNLRKKTN